MIKNYYSVFYRALNGIKTSEKLIKKIRKKFSQIDLVVIKYSSNKLGMSKPCGECLKVLKVLCVNGVYYSTDSGEIYFEKVKIMNSEHLSQSQKLVKTFKFKKI